MADENAHYLLMMNDGPTRHLDARALTFLQRMNAKYTVVDAKDFGLSSHIKSTVVEYFNPLMIGGVTRLLGENGYQAWSSSDNEKIYVEAGILISCILSKEYDK